MIDCNSYLPADVDANQVIARLGLISDTHVPIFCPSLPSILFELFREVDLILHAGDIGDLSVLDELSRSAPIVAVQGNDAGDEAERDLPLQQIVGVGGQRIFLYHSHKLDHEAEMQTHREDRWQPKLEERIALGHRMGAHIVVFGHTHIPMTYEQERILLINPGTIAPASALSRLLYRTVALLFILKNGQSRAVHVELSDPPKAFVPTIDWDQGFSAAINRFSVSLIDPALAADWPAIEIFLRNFQATPSNSVPFNILYEGLLRISRRCWTGEQQYISRVDLVQMVDQASQDSRVSQQIITDLKALLS